jgi:hypothetical protein
MENDVESRLPWISEVALKKFDYAERAFDTINTRAGVVIGWASLLTAIFFPALLRLPFIGKSIVLSLWAFPFFIMMYQGYLAYTVASLKAIPVTEDSLPELTSASNLDAHSAVIVKIVIASEINEKACSEKAKHLKRAISWFYCQLITIILSLMVTTLFFGE